MQTDSITQFSSQSLRSLEQLLQTHQALLWVDPTTNTLAVKHITQPLKEEEREPVEA